MSDDLGGAGFTASVPTMPMDAPAAPAAPPSFLETLPEAYRDKPMFQSFAKAEKPFEAFAQSYESAQTMLGKRASAIDVPTADSPPEVVSAYRKAIGVPDTVEGYEVGAPDLSQEPEAVQNAWKEASADQAHMEAYRKLAHDLGLTPAQFKGLAEAKAAMDLASLKSGLETDTGTQQARIDAERAAFKGYYGEKADTVERIAKDTVAKVIPKEVAAMGADVALIHAMHFIHENLYKNDALSSNNTTSPGRTVDDIQGQINKIRQSDAFLNPVSPHHDETRKLLDSLYKEKGELSGAR